MKLLVFNSPIDLNFSNSDAAYMTRLNVVMTAEENGCDGFTWWNKVCRKYDWIRKSYEKATGTKVF